MATIKLARPDLLQEVTGHDVLQTVPPIPQERPLVEEGKEKRAKQIEDIGEPSKATFFRKTNVDPTNW